MKRRNKKRKVEVDTSSIVQKSLQIQMLALSTAQDSLLHKLQTRKKYETELDDCPALDFTKSSNIEYSEGVFLQDLTTDEQTQLGLSIFHVRVEKDTLSPIHKHDKRYQIIFVKKGVVIDKVSGTKHDVGDIFYATKEEKHSIEYTEGSEVIFFYIPGLNLSKIQ